MRSFDVRYASLNNTLNKRPFPVIWDPILLMWPTVMRSPHSSCTGLVTILEEVSPLSCTGFTPSTVATLTPRRKAGLHRRNLSLIPANEAESLNWPKQRWILHSVWHRPSTAIYPLIKWGIMNDDHYQWICIVKKSRNTIDSIYSALWYDMIMYRKWDEPNNDSELFRVRSFVFI